MTDLEQELEAALRKIGMPTDIDDVHLFDISVLAEFICFREAEARIDELEHIRQAKTREYGTPDEEELFCGNCHMMLEVRSDSCGCDHVTADRLAALRKQDAA